MTESTKDYQSMTDLLGHTRYLSPKKGRVLDERAGLNRWFSDTFKKDGKVIALKTAHLKLNDLYYLKSCVIDRIQRQDIITARKYFYYSIKTAITK